jgi:hypothetical protein
MMFFHPRNGESNTFPNTKCPPKETMVYFWNFSFWVSLLGVVLIFFIVIITGLVALGKS